MTATSKALAPLRHERTQTLKDGTTLLLRRLTRADVANIRDHFHEKKSDASGVSLVGSDLTPSSWRFLAELDGDDHVAVAAFARREPRAYDGTLVGIARFVRPSERPKRADLEVTVSSAWTSRGVGTLLFSMIVSVAKKSGVDSLNACTLRGSGSVRRLLGRQGPLDPETFVQSHGYEDAAVRAHSLSR